MFTKLYKSKYYPLVFQIITLIVFIALIIGAIGITTDDASFAKQLRNTNLSNLLVWSYWWPLIVLAAVLFGRHWCGICPIELVTAITSWYGFKLKIPKWLKSGWAITFLYAFVAVVAIHTWGIHRIPRLMAFYLISLFALSILTALIFEKRAFCSYFCPVGKLLGLYSLLAPFGLRVEDKDVCKSCRTKDCISKANNEKLIARSCQSNIYPAKIDDNRDCILCTQCVKACPSDNIVFTPLKKSFLNFDFNNFSLAEIGMINILIGFVSYEIMSSWKISKILLLALPNWFYKMSIFQNISPKLFEGIVLFLVIPFVFVMLIALINKVIGGKSLMFYIKKLTGYLLPIIAFGHLFKALLKTVSRIPYWQYALDKPSGTFYADKILANEISINTIPWLDFTVIIIGILALIFAFGFSIYKLKKDKELQLINKIIIAIVMVFFSLLLLYGPLSSIL